MWTEIIPAGTKLVLTGFKFHLDAQVQRYELLGGLRIITLTSGQIMISFQDGRPDRWLLLKSNKMNNKLVRIKGAE